MLEPDGLIVTTSGRYVRLIECERVPNAVTADPVTLGAIERAYANVCRTIPDHQGIVVYAQTDPVPLREALEGDLELTQAAANADRAAGRHALADARGRLLEATTQTVLAAAGAEQPAVAARWWVAVPYLPRLETPREQLRSLAARSRGPDAVVGASRGGDRERAHHVADRGRAARRRDRDLSAGRHPDARAAVGATPPRDR